jgi:hypothetical protein
MGRVEVVQLDEQASGHQPEVDVGQRPVDQCPRKRGARVIALAEPLAHHRRQQVGPGPLPCGEAAVPAEPEQRGKGAGVGGLRVDLEASQGELHLGARQTMAQGSADGGLGGRVVSLAEEEIGARAQHLSVAGGKLLQHPAGQVVLAVRR